VKLISYLGQVKELIKLHKWFKRIHTKTISYRVIRNIRQTLVFKIKTRIHETSQVNH